jgi:hypothetical protein
MTYKIENAFKDYDDLPGFRKLQSDLDQYDFIDESWINEACPHLCLYLPNKKYPDRALRVWIDYKNKNLSEIYYISEQPYKRFYICLSGEYGDSDTNEISKEFESYDQTVEFIHNYLK